jgi:hypothetical protein
MLPAQILQTTCTVAFCDLFHATFELSIITQYNELSIMNSTEFATGLSLPNCYPANYLEELKKTSKSLGQDTQCVSV